MTTDTFNTESGAEKKEPSIVKYMQDKDDATELERIKEGLKTLPKKREKLADTARQYGSEQNQNFMQFAMAAAGKGDIMQAVISLFMSGNKNAMGIYKNLKEMREINEEEALLREQGLKAGHTVDDMDKWAGKKAGKAPNGSPSEQTPAEREAAAPTSTAGVTTAENVLNLRPAARTNAPGVRI